MKTKELLLEIGTEEIPAGFVPQALTYLESLAGKELEASRIDFNGIKTMGTPRRLVLVIESVSEKQRDEEIKKIGPSKQAAFDSEGRPTKAAIGFAKGQSVPVESLTLVQTEKGEYICAVRKEQGKPTVDLLSTLLPKWILSIPFQKSMKWAEVPIRFARPIHWILALFGGKVIPFELGNVRSGSKTFGHRFMYPGPIVVKDFHSYLRKTKEAYVIVDPEERRKRIEKEMIREAAKVSGKILEDEDLLNEVNFLVEYPVALCGTFENKFLSLPQEVLIHSMKEHQRYFPVTDARGKLLPYFICISNILPKHRKVVIKGNERVLKARLSDAAFFFEDDMKIPLERRVEQLKKVVFQAKLGTSFEKVMRFKQLALWMAEKIDPGLKEAVERAAYLCKADLVTGMVGEFPKLQGITGREYARRSHEKSEVAEAIYEHYLPAFAGDRLPSGPVGDIVSMADKMDTIVGCFGVGLIPTGTADPFGLRRQALGVIRILLEKKYSLSLTGMIEESEKLLKEKMERPIDQVKGDVLEFFRARYQYFLLDKGFAFDLTDAVLSVSCDDLPDVQGRIEALRKARELKDFESIVIAFKRAMNILKGAPASPLAHPASSETHRDGQGGPSQKELNPTALAEAVEKTLYQVFIQGKEKINFFLDKGDYSSALLEMTLMKKPIDDFFDGVMVMAEDEAVRNNRLALLDEIGKLFLRIADFSKLT